MPGFHAIATENAGDEVGLLRPPLREPGAAEARPEVPRAWDGKRSRRPLSARRNARRLHRAQRHDPVYPHNADWDGIAELTGDPSWGAEPCAAISSGWRTAATGSRLPLAEQARHQPHPARLRRLAGSRERRSPSCCSATETALDVRPRSRSSNLFSCRRAAPDADRRRLALLRHQPGSIPTTGVWCATIATGFRYTPLTTRGHQRTGTRERVLDAAKKHPDRLKIRAERPRHARALRRRRPRRRRRVPAKASTSTAPPPSTESGERRPAARSRASREVILAGGAFNTPQLLHALRHRAAASCWSATASRCGSTCRASARNLQDRYEVGVVKRMKKPFDCSRTRL